MKISIVDENNSLIEGEPLPEPTNLEKAILTSKLILERSRYIIEEVRSIIIFQLATFLYANAITFVQGGKGAHKSRLIELAISSLYLSLNSDEENTAGFKAYSQFFKVILIDSERSIKQFLPKAVQRIKRACNMNVDDNLPNFFPYSFIEFSRAERMQLLKEIIEMQRESYTGDIIIVIDVVSDLLANFNDLTETMAFFDYINQLINDYNISFICVIHENIGSTINKSRGHLGSEGTFKAATVVAVENKGVVNVKFLHLREGKNPGTFHLKYDDAINSLVKIDADEAKEIEVDRVTLFINTCKKILANKTRMPAGQFYNEIKDILGHSDKTTQRLINTVNTTKNCDIKIQKEKDGRHNILFLEHQNGTINEGF